MKYLIPLAMSLFSILFGCNNKKTAPKAVEEWPRFPQTDNPEVKIGTVTLDDGFIVKTFLISEDKQGVYVLGQRPKGGKIIARPEGYEPLPGRVTPMDYRVFFLEASGKTRRFMDLSRSDWEGTGAFGLIEGQLMLWIGDQFLVLDKETLDIQEKIPLYDTHSFPSKQKVELMTPDEQRDAYQEKFDALMEHGNTCKWLEWSLGGGYFVFVQGEAGKRAGWAPISWDDDLLADLKKRFEPILVSRNQNVVTSDSVNFEMSDGASNIREAEYLSGGTQLDYPNYKSRSVLQYEMLLGDKKVHFSTTDRDRHNLRLGFSDNLYLTLSDGSAWVKYENGLYRIE